jgi:hypothetical protein
MGFSVCYLHTLGDYLMKAAIAVIAVSVLTLGVLGFTWCLASLINTTL